MSTFPESPRAEFIAWCVSHGQTWAAQPAPIGLSPAQAAAFAGAVSAAQAALAAQQSARDALHAATAEAVRQVDALRQSLNDTLRVIRTFAAVSGDSGVYALAQINPPRTRTTVPPPAKPREVAVSIQPGAGSIELRWKASNPPGSSGTTYIIRRRTGGGGPWEFVGVTGVKRFTDTALAAGPSTVQYTIQGHRADAAGPVSDIVVVNFGRTTGERGGATGNPPTAAASAEPVRMAA